MTLKEKLDSKNFLRFKEEQNRFGMTLSEDVKVKAREVL